MAKQDLFYTNFKTAGQELIIQNFFGINYFKIDVIHIKIQLVESIFDKIYAKICFIGLTLGLFPL